MERSKYNVGKDLAKRTYEGIVFDSVLEMNYYRDVVCPAMDRGDITYCELQKKYTLQPKFKYKGKTILPITYVADFYIEYANGESAVIDTKGYPDAKAKIKKKMFWYAFPEANYSWVGYCKRLGGWVDYEVILEDRKKNKKAKKQKIMEEES